MGLLKHFILQQKETFQIQDLVSPDLSCWCFGNKFAEMAAGYIPARKFGAKNNILHAKKELLQEVAEALPQWRSYGIYLESI